MVPASHRMRRSQDFATAVRRGRRSGSKTVVAHLVVVGDDSPVRVGFVVNKAVGGAVTRNVVRRRLRHLIRDRLQQLSERLSGGGLLVIRALPASAGVPSSALAADLDSVLESVSRSVLRSTPPGDRKVAVSS
ncbi:ribonuclease P protein component [Flindersiella endophytica]